MKALVEKINANIEAFKVNAEAQVVKGNKAAGARARKAALELMKDLKEFRKISVGEAKKYIAGLGFSTRLKVGSREVTGLLHLNFFQ